MPTNNGNVPRGFLRSLALRTGWLRSPSQPVAAASLTPWECNFNAVPNGELRPDNKAIPSTRKVSNVILLPRARHAPRCGHYLTRRTARS
jgi:hypothetical protein